MVYVLRYIYTMKNIFSERQFSYILHVLTWRAQKMRSATSSEGPWLVGIAVPCAQTRVAIEMHSSS